MTILKHCTCCRRPLTHDDWRALPFVGFMPVESGYTLELRNCTCHSTLATHVLPMPAHIAEDIGE